MVATTGHPRDQIRIDCPSGGSPLLNTRPNLGFVAFDPKQLGGGEVRVERQASQLLDAVTVDVELNGAAVLPDNRGSGRLQSRFVPEHKSFALVGDADGGRLFGCVR